MGSLTDNVRPTPTTPPKHIFMFDMTRHRSHLVLRYFSTHPDVETTWHPYAGAALFGPERITQYTKDKTRKDAAGEWVPPTGSETYAEATRHHLGAVRSANERGHILVTKEHCQLVHKQKTSLAAIRDEPEVPYDSNPTQIPDELYSTLVPVFLIRNPVFSIPSNYTILAGSELRPGSLDWRLINEVSLQRRLFNHFREKLGYPPIVVDGDDLVWHTDEIGRKLCEALAIDFAGLSTQWEPVPQEKRHYHEYIRHMLAVVDDSTGIERPGETRPDADPEKAKARWAEKYDQQVASELIKTLERNMPHYEYLAQFKL